MPTDADEKPCDDVTFERPQPSPIWYRTARYELSVISGPDAGRRFELGATTEPRTFLGTASVCSLRIADPEVSGRHAALDLGPRGLRIRDLNSTNGTQVDGLRVVEAFLNENHLLQVGGTRIRVSRTTPSPVSTAELPTSFGEIQASRDTMAWLYPRLAQLVRMDIPVLIEGEAGTGKTLIAEELHRASDRGRSPLYEANGKAGPEELRNVIQAAAASSLLVEDGDTLSLSHWEVLLEASSKNTRLFVCTRRPLEHAVENHRLPPALYDELIPGRIEMPPLRDRPTDIPIIARYLWQRHGRSLASFPQDALDEQSAHGWPLNVTELELFLATAAGPPSTGQAQTNPGTVSRNTSEGAQALFERAFSMDLKSAVDLVKIEFRKRYVSHQVASHDGNLARAAAASGIAPSYFYLLHRGGRS